MNPFVERHQDQVSGVLSCFDRVVITGTLPDIAHPKAMTGLLGYLGIRVFDYARWAEPLRDDLRENAERLAGPSVDTSRHRLRDGRQRLRAHQRSGQGAADRNGPRFLDSRISEILAWFQASR